MAASAPLLRISIAIKDSLTVTFTSNTDRLDVQTTVSPQNLHDYLSILYRGLNNFWKLVGLELRVTDYRSLAKALAYLHGIGRQLNRELFGNERYRVEEFVKKTWHETMRNWQQSGAEGYVPPLVEVATRFDYVLPFEFLPLFDTTEPDVSNKDENTLKQELPQLASRFLGFSAIIYRVCPQLPRPSEKLIDNLPRLNLRFFHHAGLTGAQKEREFFARANWIDLRGPWPSQSLAPDSFLSSLATQLWDASDNKLNLGQSTDQIQHFACHCDTEQAHSEHYSLLLAHKHDWIGNRSLRRATIGDLDKKFGGYPRRDLNNSYPLVFLNACGSSKLTPNGVVSFPRLFLGLDGNRGFVGTETSVPDVFAAAFSRRFYLSLIQGRTLGESMYRTTWSLLKQFKNPLGLLYTIYADPDLKVRRPMPEATSEA